MVKRNAEVAPDKRIEFWARDRHLFESAVGERVLIHASKGMTAAEYENAAAFMASIGVRCPQREALQFGGVIGSVSCGTSSPAATARGSERARPLLCSPTQDPSRLCRRAARPACFGSSRRDPHRHQRRSLRGDCPDAPGRVRRILERGVTARSERATNAPSDTQRWAIAIKQPNAWAVIRRMDLPISLARRRLRSTSGRSRRSAPSCSIRSQANTPPHGPGVCCAVPGSQVSHRRVRSPLRRRSGTRPL
jgi:hypothetical protein